MNKMNVRVSDIIITKQNYTVIFEMSTTNIPQGKNSRLLQKYRCTRT